MTKFSTLARSAAAIMITAAIALAAVSSAEAQQRQQREQQGRRGAQAQASAPFDGANFSCLNYTNGLGENATGNAQSKLALVWIEGYLAGYYKAQNKLALSDDKADLDRLIAATVQRCRENPASTLITVSQQAIAPGDLKLPTVIMGDVSLAAYTCADNTNDIKGGAAERNKADVAGLWAVAFIQGYKNVENKEMLIPIENAPVLSGAITTNCGKNPNMTFLDLTAAVAKSVKLAQ